MFRAFVSGTIVLLVLSACEEPDPYAPRFQERYVPFDASRSNMPVNQAEMICTPRAEQAGYVEEQRRESERGGRYETSCRPGAFGDLDCSTEYRPNYAGNGWSAMAQGMSDASAIHRAKETTLAGCMAELGFSKQRVCVQNCAKDGPA